MLVLSDQLWAPEQGLTDVEAQVQEAAHKFAEQVIRPAGIALDRLEPGEVIAKGSQLWDAFDAYWELGLDLEEISADLDPVEVARLTFLVNEELGWGDTGLGWRLPIRRLKSSVETQPPTNIRLKNYCAMPGWVPLQTEPMKF